MCLHITINPNNPATHHMVPLVLWLTINIIIRGVRYSTLSWQVTGMLNTAHWLKMLKGQRSRLENIYLVQFLQK